MKRFVRLRHLTFSLLQHLHKARHLYRVPTTTQKGEPPLELNLKKSQIIDLASQYDVDYDLPIEKIVPEVKRKKFLTAPNC